ncbi:hypothetical protein [Leucobacter soli]|uniref:hypothetical protein n=1 Tax=Leucobacter soli TaxID=2812850 RepID=UPI00360D084F
MTTETGTVGIVASAETLSWYLMAGGFAQGSTASTPRSRSSSPTSAPPPTAILREARASRSR